MTGRGARLRDLEFDQRLYLWNTGPIVPVDTAWVPASGGGVLVWGRVTDAGGGALEPGYYNLWVRGPEFYVYAQNGAARSDRPESVLHRRRFVGEYAWSRDEAEARSTQARLDRDLELMRKRGKKKRP